jgi:hypothetical protein
MLFITVSIPPNSADQNPAWERLQPYCLRIYTSSFETTNFMLHTSEKHTAARRRIHLIFIGLREGTRRRKTKATSTLFTETNSNSSYVYYRLNNCSVLDPFWSRWAQDTRIFSFMSDYLFYESRVVSTLQNFGVKCMDFSFLPSAGPTNALQVKMRIISYYKLKSSPSCNLCPKRNVRFISMCLDIRKLRSCLYAIWRKLLVHYVFYNLVWYRIHWFPE